MERRRRNVNDVFITLCYLFVTIYIYIVWFACSMFWTFAIANCAVCLTGLVGEVLTPDWLRFLRFTTSWRTVILKIRFSSDVRKIFPRVIPFPYRKVSTDGNQSITVFNRRSLVVYFCFIEDKNNIDDIMYSELFLR